jgi:hypothetical protein
MLGQRVRRALVGAAIPSTIVNSSSYATPQPGVEFFFGVRDNTPQDPRVVRVGPHPCGEYAIARITRFPSLTVKGYLIPDLVVEVDSSNRVIRRWPKPLDSYITGIRGDRLLIDTVPAMGNRYYLISPNGTFQFHGSRLQTPSPSPRFIRRVTNHPEFGNSAYAGLWHYTDPQTGRTRRIMYEANCT